MAAGSQGEAIVQARLDREGRLLSADDRLLRLNALAGGNLGQPLALPQISMLAKLAARLVRPVTRDALVGDDGGDWQVRVHARPTPTGVDLELDDWRGEPIVEPGLPSHPGSPADWRAEGEWRWEADAEFRIVHLTLHTAQETRFPGDDLIGQPLTRLFALEEDESGAYALLPAAASRTAFAGQIAIVRDTGQRVTLSGEPNIEAERGLIGFTGTAVPIGGGADEPPASLLSADLGERVSRALRRPLLGIAASADAISTRSSGPLRSDYVDYAVNIGTAARHLLALVDDLGDLEAVERDPVAVETDDIDLADVARRAAGLLRVRAADAAVRIDAPASDEVVPARGDFRRTLQILVNVIGNAIRHSPPEGMVWIRAETSDVGAVVVIADQGRGIAPEDQPRIFDKFVRLDPGETPGSGLGLYIARRFARAMGGDLAVDSAPGQGARFALTLPGR